MRVSLAFVLCAALAVPAVASEPDVEIVGLEPTVLFPHGEPLRQVARLSLVNKSKTAQKLTLQILIAGNKPLEQTLNAVPAGKYGTKSAN